MTNTMRAISYLGPGKLELREVPIPQPNAGELIVKVKAATTCGTDLKTYRRGHKLFKPPIPFGHEWAGIVHSVGEGVSKFKEGDAVVGVNSAPCNSCFYCRRGRPQLCENLESRFLYGTYADYVRIPEHIVAQNTHPLPDNLPFEEAAILEPLACAVLGATYADIHLGDTVAIIGAGAQGLMQMQIVKAMGAARVIMLGRQSSRLERAKALGASDVLSTLEVNGVEAVRELTGGRGADVVIEAAGSAETWVLAVNMARPGATVVQFSGLADGTHVSFDARHLHYDEITIKGVFHHTPRTVEMALQLLASGQVKGSALVDGTIPLSQVEEGLLRMHRSEVVKLAVVPELAEA